MSSFYTEEELKKIGFKSFGTNVLISNKVSIYSPENMEIGNNVRIDDFGILSGNIKIGNNVHIASYVALYGSNDIEIHDYCGVSAKSIIYSATDDYGGNYLTNPTFPIETRNIIKGKVVLEKHAIVGAGCIILPNVILREGTAVGTMSLINKSTEAWSVNVGIPAKKVRDREKGLLRFNDFA